MNLTHNKTAILLSCLNIQYLASGNINFSHIDSLIYFLSLLTFLHNFLLSILRDVLDFPGY